MPQSSRAGHHHPCLLEEHARPTNCRLRALASANALAVATRDLLAASENRLLVLLLPLIVAVVEAAALVDLPAQAHRVELVDFQEIARVIGPPLHPW